MSLSIVRINLAALIGVASQPGLILVSNSVFVWALAFRRHSIRSVLRLAFDWSEKIGKISSKDRRALLGSATIPKSTGKTLPISQGSSSMWMQRVLALITGSGM